MTVYIDITNVLGLKHFTGISRVLTEVVLRFIDDEMDICLISYNEKLQKYQIIDNEEFQICFKGLSDDKINCFTDEYIDISDFKENSVFFELNSSWHTPPLRSYLLPELKKKQIRIITQIYDIIPIRYPQYMLGQTLMRFMEFLVAHMKYSDEIIVNTNAVADDMKNLFDELNIEPKPIHVINLGADFTKPLKENNSISEAVQEDALNIVSKGRYLLTVGSVEPRKNHKVMVEAYEKYFSKMGISLVIVGRTSWDMEPLVERIQSNPNFNNGLYLLSNINDTTLNYLYENAFAVLFASYIEGFGLPTIEAMIRSVPVICSDIPVMREVGGDFCDYFPADDPAMLASIVREYLNNNTLYTEKKERLVNEYIPPSWSKTAVEMERLILNKDKKDSNKLVHKPIKQIMFLSARPAPFLETIPFIEEFMQFITEVVVCCPEKMAMYLHKNYNGRLKLITITDDELLDGKQLPPDHATRNFFLRCLAMKRPELDDEFIMCDDDYRPLKPISEEVFFENGKYKPYYFSDLDIWKYQAVELFSFDFSMFRTREFLKSKGYPTLQYSSHQPQVINKNWYNELINKYPDIITKGYDEWSTYFNYCSAVHTENIQPIKYIALSWPNIGGDGMPYYQSDYIFENFYADNYMNNAPFKGLSKVFTNKESILKDNERKKLIALKTKTDFIRSAKANKVLIEEYETEYNETPSFAVHFAPEPILGVPCECKFARNCFANFRIAVSREFNCSANVHTVHFSLAFKNPDGVVFLRRAVNIPPHTNNVGFKMNFNQNIDFDREGYSLVVSTHVMSTNLSTSKEIPITFI